jgi:glutamate-5-semialdehyde dehydrogenase
MTVIEQMTALGRQAREGARALARMGADEKNQCLVSMANSLESRSRELKEANRMDMETGAQLGLSSAMLDRLRLDDARIAAMARGLSDIAALPDP